ncbi:MAG TPA: phosphoribosylamine--glycine ligase [Candidatus Koribacter sp.]|jgi:phosphoribosylamine--glycine ligase
MKVLVIGGGGREHALVWKLKQSPRVSKLYCVPGNGGIGDEAECLPGDVKSVDAMLEIANRLRPDLTVVGPEVPLMAGIVDEFEKREYPIFGPSKAAAQMEGSKSFAKLFMQRHRIPTGHYAVVSSKAELQKALTHLSAPVVVKADGLAAGKGVVIAKTKEEAATIAGDMLSGKLLGEAGNRVVLEEFLKGEELSFLVMSDGERGVPLVAAQDHKRVGDNDTGPNTGGMGAYSTNQIVDAGMREWLLTHVAKPVIQGMAEEGMPFKGILYCGLMMTAKGPMVLEFNARFGDPETQAILMRLDSDLVDAFEASVKGRISEGDFKWSADSAVTVVMASGGYPGSYEAGKKIYGLEEASRVEGVKIFHAGTSKRDGQYYTAGGRVLNVTAKAKTLPDAVNAAYDAIMKIRFDGMIYRKDIAARGLRAGN